MPSRKKAYVLLRGKLSGMLIVGSRKWYEINEVNRDRRWKLMHQSDDHDLLKHMAALGNKPSEPLFKDEVKWFER